jgi:prepilin-type N-terminal cleavage/methylation domain-containing protein
MNLHPRVNRSGFTLYEVVVALVLLSIAVPPILNGLTANTRVATDRGERTAAERVLRNEASLLAAAPAAVPSSRSYRADRSGRVDPAGRFLVETTRTTRCGVGQPLTDNLLERPLGGCSIGGVIADFAVSVTFPRVAGSADAGTITTHISVGLSALTADLTGGTP